MPIYEFQCTETNEVAEVFMSLLQWRVQKMPCPIHKRQTHFAHKIFSVPANINIGKPTIVFRNPKTGDCEVAVCDQDEPRPGFIREKLKNPFERSKFEKQAQAFADEKNAILTEKLKQDHAETRKNRHADIESRMSSFPNDGTREFLRKAMQRKSKRKFPEKKSVVKLTVNHTDSSNLIK